MRLVLLPALAFARVQVTPVQQVVQMLKEMKGKGVASMAEEKKTFEAYTEWADDRKTDLGFEIKTTKMDIEKLVAFIDKADSDAATLGTEIGQLQNEIAQNEVAQKAATTQRDSEHAEYVEAQEDLAESVDALGRAIQTLKAQSFNRPQAFAQLQAMAKKSAGMRKVLAALLQEDQTAGDDGAPAVAAYEFQSSGIVDILDKLLDKFKGQLSDTESAEANEAHAYNLEVLHLGNVIQRLSTDREGKSELKGKTVSDSASAKGRLNASKADLAESESLLAETKSTLAVKTRAFESNQQVRKEELEALDQAVNIIADSSVAGSYASHINLAQVPTGRAISLLQQSSHQHAAREQAKTQVVVLLQKKATALGSSLLASAVARMADSPFAKVIEMIEGLLTKLKEEAASEADHKAFCDKELQTNKLKRDEKTSSVNSLTAEVQKYDAEIADMADELQALTEEQAALAKAMQESSEQRTAEKAENEATIKDSEEAQQALKKALVVLREFYSAQAAPALVQTKQVPEMAAYTGMQGNKGGVVGMIEVIESDFMRLETETKAAEAQAAAEYDEFMATSRATAKSKHDREFKQSLAKDDAEFKRGRVQEDLTFVESELSEAQKYYESLKPQCLQVHVSYEERAEQRKQEIEALKESYKILDGMGA